MSDTTKDLIGQTGGKSAKFEAVGDTVAGKVVSTAVLQVRNFQTGEPETWDNGDPKQQIAITVESDSRDASDPEDDGVRTIYIKWWGLQRRALQDAVHKAGDDDIRIGGTFSATYTGDGEQKARGFNPPKLYTYIYTPPSPTAGLLGGQQQAAPANPPVTAAAATPSPTVTAATPTSAAASAVAAADPQAVMAQVKGLIAIGMTDAQIAAAFGIAPDAIAAIRNLPAAS